MCGLAGIIRFDGQPVQAEPLLRMAETMRHRGPDDAGHLVHGSVGLAHQRLSIIDLNTGHQPMASGQSVIVFNGEIYNYVELRQTAV